MFEETVQVLNYLVDGKYAMSIRAKENNNRRVETSLIKEALKADRIWQKFKDNQNFRLFLGMYKIKGSHNSRSSLCLQSIDPENIKFTYYWFRRLSKSRVDLYVYLPRTKTKKAKQYWESEVKADHYSYYNNHTVTSPYGSVRIQLNDSCLCGMMEFWMDWFDEICPSSFYNEFALQERS